MVARLLIVAGIALAGLGLIWPLFGHMPGDFQFWRGGAPFFIPLGSCFLASIYFTAALIGGFWFLWP
ncbi:MAG: DUF2905 domain-containing protein [Rhodospirillales bacterium]|nr:DUF2905 domain-containing protein [Rhodospirillales bacterium]